MRESNIDIIEISENKNIEYIGMCLEIRKKVFIIEQNVPADIEIDEYDGESYINALKSVHIIAFYGGLPAGTGRLIEYMPDEKICKIGRLAVLPEFRKKSIAAKIFECLINKAKEFEYSKIIIHAQCYVAEFYKKFGFVPAGEVFDEAGIDHIKMYLKL